MLKVSCIYLPPSRVYAAGERDDKKLCLQTETTRVRAINRTIFISKLAPNK